GALLDAPVRPRARRRHRVGDLLVALQCESAHLRLAGARGSHPPSRRPGTRGSARGGLAALELLRPAIQLGLFGRDVRLLPVVLVRVEAVVSVRVVVDGLALLAVGLDVVVRAIDHAAPPAGRAAARTLPTPSDPATS